MTALDLLISIGIPAVEWLWTHMILNILKASATVLLIAGLRTNHEIPLVLHLVTISLVAALIVFRPNALLSPRILLTVLRAFVYDLHL